MEMWWFFTAQLSRTQREVAALTPLIASDKLAQLEQPIVSLRFLLPGSSMVEHSAVNRRVASSNLARGASSFSLA
jgi:hypothetical protein